MSTEPEKTNIDSGTFLSGQQEEEMVATVAIDIGTNRIRTAVVGRSETGNVRLLAYGSVASLGIRAGVIADVKKASDVLQASLHQVKQKLGVSGAIRVAIIGIGGLDIIAAPTDSHLTLSKKWLGKSQTITFEDLYRLKEHHHHVFISSEYEQLDLIPMGYSVDGENWLGSPVGLEAQNLFGRYLSIAARKDAVDIVNDCCKRSTVSIKSTVYAPATMDRVALEPSEKSVGSIVFDIGYAVTNVLFIKDGIWQHAFPVPCGSYDITSDIAQMCELPFDAAEELKKKYGVTKPVSYWDDTGKPVAPEPIAVTGNREIDPDFLYRIISARCEEMFDMAMDELYQRANRAVEEPVVLSGGGAMLPGFVDFAQRYLKRPVRLAKPSGIQELSGEALTPAAINVLGMAMYGFELTSLNPQNPIARLFDWVNGS